MARGVMVLSVLASHWGPGLFARLGAERLAEAWLSLVYRAGTPGFAAVFGIGIGYFMLPRLPEARAAVRRRLWTSLALVVLGMVLIAALVLAVHLARGGAVSGLTVAHSFYNVLAFYAVALATGPIWLGALARLHRPELALVALVPACWLAWQAAAGATGALGQLDGVLEWPRLMLGAGGYNIFKMAAVVAAGIALGLWIARHRGGTRDLSDRLLVAGGAGMALCAIAMVQIGGPGALSARGSNVFVSIPGLLFYVATAAALTGTGLRLTAAWGRLPEWGRWPLRVLVVIGALALPIFVFHYLVIPARTLIVLTTGAPGAVALAVSMGAFLAAMGYAGRRVWRMYFAAADAPDGHPARRVSPPAGAP